MVNLAAQVHSATYLCGCEMTIGFDIAHEEAGGKRRYERPDRFLLATRSTVSEPRTRRIPKVFVHSGVSFSKARWRMARSQHATLRTAQQKCLRSINLTAAYQYTRDAIPFAFAVWGPHY